MFLPTKFYIYKENDQVLELREKKSRLYIGCIILILMGSIYIYMTLFPNNYNPETDYWPRMALIVVGGLHLFFGLIPLVISGKILLNKKERTLKFFAGYRKFLFHPLTIPFSQVSHISIEEYYSGSHGFGLYWDKIVLKRNNKFDIKIDHSRDAIYVSEISKKLSDFLNCKVFYQSH